jgi:RPA family protein
MKTFIALIMLTLFSISPAIADQITPLGDVKRGSMITVQGNVEKILDTDEFRLVDQTGSIRVYVGPNWVPAQVG